MKKRLYMVAVNQRYGANAFLPLAGGLMWAYARKFSEITDAYECCDMLFVKEPIEKALSRIKSPDVVAFSHFIWNAEWNKQLATAIKNKWPRCAALIGGVQVPNASPRILEECPQFDFAIYGEGEGAFADFLRENRLFLPQYKEVGSLIWRHGGPPLRWPEQVIVNPRRAQVPLEEIPSPYLEGLFDDILKDNPQYKFQALQETNRGCYAECTFCAWGDASQNQMRKFDAERVYAEYEWFGKNSVEYLYNCDSNYALYKRDIELTQRLIETKKKYGCPKLFRAAYAKGGKEIVFEVSKMLADAGMLKATTFAMQSMDDNVLTLIKRKNLKYEKFAEYSARYEAEGISTYAEIIVGLPGETLDSFIDGLDALLTAGQHDAISIYLCMILENTEMAAPEYRRAHGIETVHMKALLYHGTPEPDVVEEIQETVVATTTMPRADLTQAVLYGWVLQALHGFGLTQHYMRSAVAAQTRGSYSVFYSALMALAENRPDTVLGRAYARVKRIWERACAGESWDTVDARFGDISWPPEELLLLDIACEADKFYTEVGDALVGQGTRLRALWEEQRAMFIPPKKGREEEWSREAIWFGRKGSGRKLRLREKEIENV